MNEPAAEPEPRVVLVAGYGRSGSTILDRVLGHHPDIFAVGELVNVHRELWQANHYCGCGRRGRDCPFWEDVRHRWLGGRGDGAVANYLALRKRALGRLGIRRAGAVDRSEQREVLRETATLFAAVAAASGSRVIVDSSKSPGWVDSVRRIPGMRLSVVHLIRDGRGVIASLKRPLAKDVAGGVQHDIAAQSALHTSLAWMAGNVAAEQVIRQSGLPNVRLAYETLTTAPSVALAAVGRIAGVNLHEEARMIEDSEPFPRTHAVAGGRVRMSERVVIEREARRAQISSTDEAVFWLTAGALAWRYGYRPRRPLPDNG